MGPIVGKLLKRVRVKGRRRAEQGPNSFSGLTENLEFRRERDYRIESQRRSATAVASSKAAAADAKGGLSMVLPRISVTILGLAALACCAVGALSSSNENSAGAQSVGPTPGRSRPFPPPSQRLIWGDNEPERAIFVPEEVLASRPLEDIPMGTYLRDDLLSTLNYRRNPLRHLITGKPLGVDCRRSSEPAAPGSSPRAEELLDAILGRDAAVLATVDYVVPGWGHTYAGPETAVYGTVIEALHDTVGTFRPRAEVSFLRSGADIRVQGVQLCSEPAKGEHEARPHDRLLIIGYASKTNPGLLYTNTVFPVEQGTLTAQPLAHIKGRMGWTLDELRAALVARRRPQ